MYSVLIGVDGSEDSRTALRWASVTAKALGLPLRAMWAWHYPNDAIVSIGRIDLPTPARADGLIETQLRHLLDDVLGDDAAHDVRVEVGRGPGAAALLRAAAERTAMLVVGSRGLGGFKGLLLGSVSRQLCEHAPCPVTVVRRAAPDHPPQLRTVLVGTDGSPEAAHAMRFAGDLATKVGAELLVANAAGPGEVVHPRDVDPHVDRDARRELVEEWCEPLRQAGVTCEVAVVEGDARTALLDLADVRGADLIVVGSRGHGPVARLLIGSVASSLTHHSHLPVTVVPRHR
jgi:nucleotide-binding universal stress UspA family protein